MLSYVNEIVIYSKYFIWHMCYLYKRIVYFIIRAGHIYSKKLTFMLIAFHKCIVWKCVSVFSLHFFQNTL